MEENEYLLAHFQCMWSGASSQDSLVVEKSRTQPTSAFFTIHSEEDAVEGEVLLDKGQIRDLVSVLQAFLDELEEPAPTTNEVQLASEPKPTLKKWRCTIPQRYRPGTPGHTDPSARQGYYCEARDYEEAVEYFVTLIRPHYQSDLEVVEHT